MGFSWVNHSSTFDRRTSIEPSGRSVSEPAIGDRVERVPGDTAELDARSEGHTRDLLLGLSFLTTCLAISRRFAAWSRRSSWIVPISSG
jgi:hypothetical protein